MFDRVEPHPIVRVIGSIRAIGVNGHTCLIDECLHPGRIAGPRHLGMVPKELTRLRMVRRRTGCGKQCQYDEYG
jgi:hypothetical protein